MVSVIAEHQQDDDGGGRIRTLGPAERNNGFQDRRHQPLGHASYCADSKLTILRLCLKADCREQIQAFQSEISRECFSVCHISIQGNRFIAYPDGDIFIDIHFYFR